MAAVEHRGHSKAGGRSSQSVSLPIAQTKEQTAAVGWRPEEALLRSREEDGDELLRIRVPEDHQHFFVRTYEALPIHIHVHFTHTYNTITTRARTRHTQTPWLLPCSPAPPRQETLCVVDCLRVTTSLPSSQGQGSQSHLPHNEARCDGLSGRWRTKHAGNAFQRLILCLEKRDGDSDYDKEHSRGKHELHDRPPARNVHAKLISASQFRSDAVRRAVADPHAPTWLARTMLVSGYLA